MHLCRRICSNNHEVYMLIKTITMLLIGIGKSGSDSSWSAGGGGGLG